jgi:hypothetical protein
MSGVADEELAASQTPVRFSRRLHELDLNL